ncbi:hypothetical protein AMS68_007781 [Peltaster fructicola]|uniref:Caffeine-induced death protein Cid2 n=1 Tax=Peltaster fructicola TaxID=286661 RepID=A0A6H0Y5H4_9PEZI|nr:hypothetical protein AMS68_007781 [Peltaster fructicola]
MSGRYEAPALTPQFCFNQTALRDFLRLSRGAVDDTIGQNLNDLLTPGNQQFNPSSTALRQPRPTGRSRIDPQACTQFREKVLFPSWQARDQVLHYCARVATSPDPDDIQRQAEDEEARRRVINERLDPYSGRYFPRDTRGEALANLLRNENMVESIIRTRTWQSVGERCGHSADDFEVALEEWRGRR